jgi:vancomycin permeability regulator SanA
MRLLRAPARAVRAAWRAAVRALRVARRGVPRAGRAARQALRPAAIWRLVRRVARLRVLDRLVRLGVATVLLGLVVSGISVAWMRSGTGQYIHDEASVPVAPVALVLGAQVYEGGVPSPFLTARLEIALRLYRSGKVKAILVSGDHREWRYDEPGSMLRWLTQHDVPPTKVVLDHAGFDTYDSCVRANKIFGVQRAIVVTQSYHLPRAVKLCRRLGIETYGVGDETMRGVGMPWWISSNREHGACVKAVYDVVSGRDPVFLGPRESGVDDALRVG